MEKVTGSSGPSPLQTEMPEAKETGIAVVTPKHADIVSEPAKPYDSEQHRDWVRATATFSSVALLSVTILGALCMTIATGVWANAKDLVQLALPAETGLMGSVVGFYFGSHKANE